MSYGVHGVPDPFEDEDKWFFLTKRQWLILLPPVTLLVLSIVGMLAIGLAILLPFVIIVLVMVCIGAAIIAFFDMPQNWYIFGGGQRIEKILFRLLKKTRKSSKKIYTKHFDNGTQKWNKK